MQQQQQRYSARRAFKYNGTMLDRGQVMLLAGFANDEKLTRLGFLTEVRGSPVLYQCGLCEECFISDRQRTKHGNRAHPGAREPEVPVMTAEQGKAAVNRIMTDPTYEPVLVPDETISDQEKENESEAPVFMEKTEASVKGGYGVGEVTTEQLEADLKPPRVTPFDEGVKAGEAAAAEGRIIPEPGENPYVPVPDPIIMEKPLVGRDLKKWRTKQKLTQAEASEMLGVAAVSISRAEKSRKKPLGSKLAPALKAALGR